MVRLMNSLTLAEDQTASGQTTGKSESLYAVENESAILGVFSSKIVAEAAAEECVGEHRCCTMLGDRGLGSIVYAVHDPTSKYSVYVRRVG